MDRSDPMTEFFDAHRPATAFDHDSTLVVAMELSGKSWQLGAVVPGVSRRPKRGLKVGDMDELLRVLERWKAEAARRGGRSPAWWWPTRRGATVSGSPVI